MPFDLSKLNELMNDVLNNAVGSRQPRMAYYRKKHGRKMFGYNIEPLSAQPKHDNKQWCAVMYKSVKNGWQLVKERYFRKRKSAKACATKWYWANERRKEKRKTVASQQLQ